MKKFLLMTLMVAACILTTTACSGDSFEPEQPETEQPEAEEPAEDCKILVAYFSATGNTQAVANRIAELTRADLYSIQPSVAYASNPYDDTELIQNEAYTDLRPAVANLPESLDQYDIIYVGSPIWWHQPAMVVCTFLDNYDLSGKTVIPFYTFGARTYLNESMQKIYRLTPNSTHIPETLPEDLDPDNIQTPQADDEGIDMPGNANGVEAWLRRMGQIE